MHALPESPGYNVSRQKTRRNRQRSEEWPTLMRSVATESSMSDLGKLVLFKAGDYVNVIEQDEQHTMRAFNVYFVGVHSGTYYGYIHTEGGKKQFVHFGVNCIYSYVRASSPLIVFDE